MDNRDSQQGTRQADFVKTYHYYVNTDLNLGSLLYRLYSRSAPLGIVDRNTRLITRRLKKSLLYKMGRIASRYLCAKIGKVFGSPDGFVRLPSRGEIAIYCFPNYVRIFDLRNRTICNYFGEQDQAARHRIDTIVQTQALLAARGVAPGIISCGENGSEYVEELCEGTSLNEHRWWREEVFEEICRKIRVLQKCDKTERQTVGNVIEEIHRNLMQLKDYREGSENRDVYRQITERVDALARTMDAKKEIQTCLSHGDLARRNALANDNDELVFIDWQTVGFRCKDYDLYNYHFSIVQDGCEGQISEKEIYERLNKELGWETQEQLLEALNEFALFFWQTKIKWFLVELKNAEISLTKQLSQIADYERILERYADYCRSGNI